MTKEVEGIVQAIPDVEGVLSVVGLNFIDYLAASNQAFFVIRLKPFEERTDPGQSVGAIIAQLRPRLAALLGAIAFPLNLPPILGLGSTGSFQYALEALQGQSPVELAATLRGLVAADNQQPELSPVFSTYAADTPQIYLDIDRDKRRCWASRSTTFSARCRRRSAGSMPTRLQRLRPHLAGQRPVRIFFRDQAEDIYRIYVRNAKDTMVPMRALATVKLVQGPQAVETAITAIAPRS